MHFLGALKTARVPLVRCVLKSALVVMRMPTAGVAAAVGTAGAMEAAAVETVGTIEAAAAMETKRGSPRKTTTMRTKKEAAKKQKM